MSTRSQVFTSSGTFNVPATVGSVFVSMLGGGGSGGAGSNSGFGGGGGGGDAGGSGELAFNVPVKVTPGGTLAITVGAGGAAVIGSQTDGNNGTATICGPFQVGGGFGGSGAHINPPARHGFGGGFNGGECLGNGVVDCSRPVSEFGAADGVNFFGGSGGGTGGNGGGACGGTGGPNTFPSGGVGGLPDGVFSAGGGGGSASFLGDGVHGPDAPGHNGLTATVAGTGGSGGGGGGGAGNGGAGASGWVMVQWYET